MDYSEALIELKAGKLLARAGWNGKAMFVFLVPGSTFEVNRPPLLGIFPIGTILSYAPHIDMRTASGVIVPWLCSQSDAMAEDWEIVEAVAIPVKASVMTDGRLHAAAFNVTANP